jgi:hypothetical protein
MLEDDFIIILDVDGVLCSYDENIYMPDCVDKFDVDDEHFFKREAIDALNVIIKHYNASLCMVSSWNSKFKDEEHYKQFLIRRGIIVNNLYIGNQHNRTEFITDLINDGLRDFLIIDDEAHQYFQNMDVIPYNRILRPDRNRCLDKYDAKFYTINLKLK